MFAETRGIASAGTGVTGGRVRVLEEKIIQGSSRQVSLADLYANPRYRAFDDRIAVILDLASQIMLKDLRNQLQLHWQEKGLKR
jgi:hypothetical protein